MVTGIYILWLREVKRYFRSRPQIIAWLAQPLLYLPVLGFGLGPVFSRPVTAATCSSWHPASSAWRSCSCPSIRASACCSIGSLVFSKETLVARVPRLHIMIGRTLGGATIALLQGTLVLTVCVIAGFRPHLSALPLALLFMALVAVVFAALGTTIGSTLRDMQGFQLIMNFLVLPIFFLSGALFPLGNLPAPLAVATRLDPLSYGVDGLRGALIGSSHFGMMADFVPLVVVAGCFVALGARAFSKIQI